MITCKQFLIALNDYLDDVLEVQARAAVELHMQECPRCFILCDSTRKTLQVCRCLHCDAIPPDVESRLWAALARCTAVRASQRRQFEI